MVCAKSKRPDVSFSRQLTQDHTQARTSSDEVGGGVGDVVLGVGERNLRQWNVVDLPPPLAS
jgi:hypothetical protein